MFREAKICAQDCADVNELRPYVLYISEDTGGRGRRVWLREDPDRAGCRKRPHSRCISVPCSCTVDRGVLRCTLNSGQQKLPSPTCPLNLLRQIQVERFSPSILEEW